MSATDLARYLTDEVAESALAAGNAASECYYGCPSDMTTTEMHASLSAVLPDIIRQAKAEALREAADQLDAYSPCDTPAPSDPRWTCDLGYYGEAAWLRARADRIEQGGQP